MNTTTTIQLKDRNEYSVYEAFNLWSLELVLDCLTASGSLEKQVALDTINREDAVSRLVDDVREFGIEVFVKRLNDDLALETCSLLQLSAANNDHIETSKNEIESLMKRNSLTTFFQMLTPHLLYTYCTSIGIKLPKSFSNLIDHQSSSSDNNGNHHHQQVGGHRGGLYSNKTIVNSVPSIQVVDNTTIISTRTTKTSTQKYKGHRRNLTLGEGVAEGSTQIMTMIKLLIEEIILSGLENLFYQQNLETLTKIYNYLKIKDTIPNKLSNIISNIVPFIFHIQQPIPSPRGIPSIVTSNRLYPDIFANAIVSTPSSSSPNNNKNVNNNNNQKQQQDFKRKYPQTPNHDSSDETSSSSDDSDEEDEDSNDQTSSEDKEQEKGGGHLIKRKKLSNPQTTTTASSTTFNKQSNQSIPKLPGKLYFNDVMTTDEEDNEIDSPPEQRPKMADIKEGISKDRLQKMLVRDLRQWLKSKKLKATSSDNKEKLCDRIISFLETSKASEASESDTDNGRKSSQKKNS